MKVTIEVVAFNLMSLLAMKLGVFDELYKQNGVASCVSDESNIE